jgi:hypothetical protein
MAMIWLKGDVHCHSKFSDGDSSVKDILDEAKKRANLDFLAITDHDTHFQDHPESITTWSDPSYVSSAELVLLYGIEWTDSEGHANIWAPQAYDYSAIWATNENKDPDTAIELSHQQGALFSYNHPASRDPWTLATSRNADCVEIWNSVDDYNHNFEATFKFWDDLLLRFGKRITAVGGSDMHNLHGVSSSIIKFGRPRLWVLSQGRTQQDILHAIKAGRVTISATEDTARLEMRADRDLNGNYDTLLGDIVSLTSNAQVDFQITLDGGNTAGQVTAVEQEFIDNINGQLETKENYSSTLETITNKADSSHDLVVMIKDGLFLNAWLINRRARQISQRLTVNGLERSYYRAELYGKSGRLAATNPIYFNFLAEGTIGSPLA